MREEQFESRSSNKSLVKLCEAIVNYAVHVAAKIGPLLVSLLQLPLPSTMFTVLTNMEALKQRVVQVDFTKSFKPSDMEELGNKGAAVKPALEGFAACLAVADALHCAASLAVRIAGEVAKASSSQGCNLGIVADGFLQMEKALADVAPHIDPFDWGEETACQIVCRESVQRRHHCRGQRRYAVCRCPKLFRACAAETTGKSGEEEGMEPQVKRDCW